MPRASDLFGTPSGTPESDMLISASPIGSEEGQRSIPSNAV
jgi:hypothetical protein